MGNQISVTVTGSSRTDLVKGLRAFADNLDGAPPAKNGLVVEEPEATDDFVQDVVKNGKKAKAAPAAAFDDDEATELEAAEEAASDDFGDAEEIEEAPPKKATKAKAPTKEDVNDACKAHAKKHTFDKTKALLTKKFGTASVSKLKPEQYPAVIAAMKV